MYVVLASDPAGVRITQLDDSGAPVAARRTIAREHLPAEVAALERERPRWVWDDTSRWYPQLLAAGVRVERCVDLRLCHVILRNSALTAGSELATAERGPWDAAAVDEKPALLGTLFDLEAFGSEGTERTKGTGAHTGTNSTDSPRDRADPVAEFLAQRAAVAASAGSGRLNLLLAAESAGALVASEMRLAGLPWNVARHDELLAELLGARPKPGERPAILEAVLQRVRDLLEAPELNPDSPNDLLRALRRAGLVIDSTRSWELKKLTHPAIEPLLEYKKLARLMAANGWNWVDTWIENGRFRPDYVPGGVVTGRWATSGGGALQLPRQVRGAVMSDPGWKFVVADAAQLEPRVLAGLAGDAKMAEAGRGDLYEGIVASGAVATRAEAKVAMLGAMYGATSGDGGRLMPRLAKAFPAAIAMVEAAARAGERGEVVTTRLGRSSPPPGESWRDIQGEAYGTDASAADQKRAISQSRGWGRFTRNFIVQGTAAEWALCWMAGLRNRLWELGTGPLTERPHLVFFLHDEVIVHTPKALADQVAAEVRAAAADAGRLIFGSMPVDFPVTTAIVESYADAK
ncbi:MAG: polymerase [Glaciihabitans sp.]|nr:polymerase [Glaciihabitans sp.]